jgi:T4-like virus Myoviridae tail sheath stabiliser
MFSNIYNNNIIRKITTAFGSLFTNLVLVRYDYSSGLPLEQQRTLIPLVFGQKEKYIQALQGDPLQDNKISIKLPIISYALKDVVYDSTRKQQTTLQNVNGQASQYVPVPYNINFEVYIYVRNIEDGTQIIEQILPYFTPDYTLTLNVIPSMNITNDIPFTLNKANYELLNESEARTPESRTIIWTLSFTAKANIYGPVNNSSGIIKEAIINLYNWNQLEGKNVYLIVSGNTNGTFLQSENVYQGPSFEQATATGSVTDWDPLNNRLLVNNLQGMLYTNTPIIGQISGASYALINYEIEPIILETITVTGNVANNGTVNTGNSIIYTINISANNSYI